MPRRKTIADAVQASVLIKCKRRCCLCSFLHDDLNVRDGQIAHIDRDSTNAAEDNLAYLCFDHHNKYDTRQSQGKNLTPLELRHALDDLHQRVRATRSSAYEVTLELNQDLGTLTSLRREQVLSALQVGDSDDIHLIRKGPGIVILVLKLIEDKMQQFVRTLESDEVEQLGIRLQTVRPVPSPADDLEFGGAYLQGIQEIVVPRSQVIDIVRHSETVQHLRGGSDASFENSVCSIFAKRFGAKRDNCTCLTLTYNLSPPMLVFCAIRVYTSEVPHSAWWRPLDILKAFLDRYGVDSTAPCLEPVRLVQDFYVQAPTWVRSPQDMDAALMSILTRVTTDAHSGWIDCTLCQEYLRVMTGSRIELFFSMERRKYGLDLREHGINVRMQLIPDTQTALRDGLQP